jgi:protein ImuB
VPARIACVLVPLFPLAARLRSEPELSGEAVAILAGNGSAARIVAASRPARKAGIRAGFSLSQARAMLPRLIARASDPVCERSAQEALLEAAETISLRIENAGGGLAYLDVDGMERCFPSEHALGQSLMAAIEAAGLPSRVGIAGSKLASRVAAESPGSPLCVPPAGEAEFLSALPLSRLTGGEVAKTLARWGLRTIGEFAKLSEGEVVARLGEAGRRLHLTARGIDPSPLVPRMPLPSFVEGMDLEWPLVSVEPFLFVARAALERLAERLCAQALACASLALELKLDPDGVDARSIKLPAPTREVKTLLTLVRLNLESKPLGAPVIGFRFDAHPDRPRSAQRSLFGPAALSPGELATCIAKLSARLGADRVGQPASVNGHRPERFALAPYDPPAPPDFPASPRAGRGLLTVRVLRPAVALEVMTDSAGRRGSPTSLRSMGGEIEIRGEVPVASGPWRLEEEWWSEDGADRDYWDIELSDGALYRIFQERKSGAWFADGIYD